MREHGYEFCYMNLLSILRKQHTPLAIEQIAIRCMHQHLCASVQFREFMRAAAASPVLPPEFDALLHSIRFDPASLAALTALQQDTGVLLAPFHWGAFRYIAIGIERCDLSVTVLMDRATIEPQHPLLAAAKEQGRQTNLGVQYVMAEDPAALVAVHRVLAAKGLVMIYPDGNSGWDGPKGKQGRTGVEFAGYHLLVKNGIARLAHVTQSPVAILVAELSPAGEIVISLRKVMTPPKNRGAAAAEQFSQHCMQQIYSEMERCVLTQPELWESARQFHRWRIPESVDGHALLSTWQHELHRTLTLGRSYTVDSTKLTRVGVGERTVWVDASTMRVYGGDAFTTDALTRIEQPGGLVCLWHETAEQPARRKQLINLLGLLATRGLLKRDEQISCTQLCPTAHTCGTRWSGATEHCRSCTAPQIHSAREHHGAANQQA
jgi:hypothetical protein